MEKYQAITRKDFTEFRRFKNILGGFSLMPVNPNTPGSESWNRFEYFRQSNEFETKGRWPERTIFKRHEVCFIDYEYTTVYGAKSVKQVAVYAAKPMLSKSNKRELIAILKRSIKLVSEMRYNLSSIIQDLKTLETP